MKSLLLFSKTLLNWFEENQRSMPWRGEAAPYRIWISEIILQQTRVNQGWKYYERFIERFPNCKTLAEASLQDVLYVWQGLGYYSRARNIHAAAQQIMLNHNGIFPDNYLEIRKLKGIGHYSAAAIGSIAFNLPYPAVDGNVLRVISRIFGIYDDITYQRTVRKITAICEKIMDKKYPGDFNQALMELGATQCIPKNPTCITCPFTTCCVALKNKQVHILPVKSSNIKIIKRFFHYYIFIKESKTIIEQRTKSDIWKNLYQFPLIETKDACEIVSRKELLKAGLGKCIPVFKKELKHKLTHQHLTIRIYEVNDFFPKIQTQWMVLPFKEVKNFPFPVVLNCLNLS